MQSSQQPKTIIVTEEMARIAAKSAMVLFKKGEQLNCQKKYKKSCEFFKAAVSEFDISIQYDGPRRINRIFNRASALAYLASNGEAKFQDVIDAYSVVITAKENGGNSEELYLAYHNRSCAYFAIGNLAAMKQDLANMQKLNHKDNAKESLRMEGYINAIKFYDVALQSNDPKEKRTALLGCLNELAHSPVVHWQYLTSLLMAKDIWPLPSETFTFSNHHRLKKVILASNRCIEDPTKRQSLLWQALTPGTFLEDLFKRKKGGMFGIGSSVTGLSQEVQNELIDEISKHGVLFDDVTGQALKGNLKYFQKNASILYSELKIKLYPVNQEVKHEEPVQAAAAFSGLKEAKSYEVLVHRTKYASIRGKLFEPAPSLDTPYGNPAIDLDNDGLSGPVNPRNCRDG